MEEREQQEKGKGNEHGSVDLVYTVSSLQMNIFIAEKLSKTATLTCLDQLYLKNAIRT